VVAYGDDGAHAKALVSLNIILLSLSKITYRPNWGVIYSPGGESGGEVKMGNQCCIQIPCELRQAQIDEIVRIRGPHDGLTSANDVVIFALNQLRERIPGRDEDVEAFAVDQLHQRVLKSRAAELERHLIWRRNLR